MSALCSIPGGPLTELAECKCSFSDIYQTSELANALHQIPHLNYLFQHVSSNFTYSTEYAQGVAFWAVCFIALYIFLMVHLLLYSICMCRMVRKSRNTGWLKWNGKPNICLTIFGVLSFIGLAVCAVGIWSDIEQNKTLVNFVDVFKSVNNLISTLDTDIKTVPVKTINSLLTDITTEIYKLPANTTDLAQYKEEVANYLGITETIMTDIKGVTDKLDKISLGQLDTMMEQGVLYRLIATLLVFCITAVVLFASIIYAIKPLTRYTGFVFLLLVAFLLAVWWLLGSLAFSADIALADFCISPNPDKFIQSQITLDPQYKEGTEYLLYCHGCANPFTEVINIEGKIQQVNSTLESFINFTAQHGSELHTDAIGLQLQVVDAFRIVNTIVNKDLSCNQTSSLYANAIQDGCYGGLQHFTIETSCAIVLAVIFLVLTTVQCFNSCKLISYYTNKNRKVKRDFQGLPDMTFHPEVARDTIVEPRRTPGFHQDPNRMGYTRTMDGPVSETVYPAANPEGYVGPSGANMYPDLPLEIFTGDVTGTTIQNDVFFTNVEYIYSPTDQDTILSGPSRTSSMQESLQAFFPELANSIQSEESKRFSPRFENLYV